MGQRTSIAWATDSFNPWIGCTKVSPGCANCYAETESHRRGWAEWGKGKPRHRTGVSYWRQPLAWNKRPWVCDLCGKAIIAATGIAAHLPVYCLGCGQERSAFYRRRVFCGSLCDWLDPEVPIEWLADLLDLIRQTPELTWLMLSKRLELFFARRYDVVTHLTRTAYGAKVRTLKLLADWTDGKPPPNVWMGTSIEDQERADQRIPELLKIPAAVRFLSVEPLLGPVDLWGARYQKAPGSYSGAVSGWKPSVDWVIVGGESGSKARVTGHGWIRDVVMDCKAAGVPVFVKQLGSRIASGGTMPERLRHPKGGDPAEWPADLRVREFPEVTR